MPRKRSPLPPPPRPAPEFFELDLESYVPHLSLSVALTGAFAGLAHAADVPWIGALAGVCATPLLFFQHDVGHALARCRTQAHINLCSATSLVTGTYWVAGPWRIHNRHHSRTGDDSAWLVPDVEARFGNDMDDYLGPLRGGNPLGAEAARSPILRAVVVAVTLLASIFSFQAMFVLKAFKELGRYGEHVPGDSYENRKSQDRAALQGALITAVHLCLGLACLGPMGYLAFSMGISAGLQTFAAGFHQPKGVEDYGHGHYYDRQMQSATNLKLPDHPFFEFLLFGSAGYHIEHHLWEHVPAIHLPKLSQVSKDYCKLHGLDYREVTLTEAWSAWLSEAWRLSGEAPSREGSRAEGGR